MHPFRSDYRARAAAARAVLAGAPAPLRPARTHRPDSPAMLKALADMRASGERYAAARLAEMDRLQIDERPARDVRGPGVEVA